MPRLTLIAALVFVAVSAPALAQATASQRAACTPDVLRLCSSEIPDVAAIKACLRRERARLGGACRVVMDEADRPQVATRSIALAR